MRQLIQVSAEVAASFLKASNGLQLGAVRSISSSYDCQCHNQHHSCLNVSSCPYLREGGATVIFLLVVYFLRDTGRLKT